MGQDVASVSAELTQLSELIDHIYQGAIHPESWHASLPKIAHWVNARYGLLFTPIHTPDKGGFYFNHEIPESVMHLWATRWQGEDLIANTAVQQGLFVEGGIALGHEIVPYEQIQQSAIYRELNHPNGIDHHLIGVVFDFSSPNGIPAVLTFYRSDDHGPFTEHEKARLGIVLPHVSRALGVMMRLRDAELRIAASLAALDRLSAGVLLLNAAGQVSFANRAALRIVEEDDGLQLRQLVNRDMPGELVADDPKAHVALSAAIRQAVSPDLLHTEHFSRAVLVPRFSGRQEYVLNFSSLPDHHEFGQGEDGPRAIVFITDSAEPIRLDGELLRKTYGLTPAEIRLAESLTECLTLDETAAALGLSRSTIKTQLQSIYLKTNINNRGKLMRLLMSLSQAA